MTGVPYDARGKDPTEIEHDIEATRAELGAVIDALEQRLAPRHLVEKGMAMMKDTLDGNGGAFGASLRAHPVPLALVGAGLGWLLVAGAAGTTFARRAAGEVADSSASDAGEELAGYAYARTKPRLSVAAAAAAKAAAGARAGLGRAIDDNPLALAFLGLLAGAAVGLLLPKSRIAARIIGPAGARIRDDGQEAVERAKNAAMRAARCGQVRGRKGFPPIRPRRRRARLSRGLRQPRARPARGRRGRRHRAPGSRSAPRPTAPARPAPRCASARLRPVLPSG